jgi:hypothetical protein
VRHVEASTGENSVHEEVMHRLVVVGATVTQHRDLVTTIGGVVARRSDECAGRHSADRDSVHRLRAQNQVEIGTSEPAGAPFEHDDVLVEDRQVNQAAAGTFAERIPCLLEPFEKCVVRWQVGPVDAQSEMDEHHKNTSRAGAREQVGQRRHNLPGKGVIARNTSLNITDYERGAHNRIPFRFIRARQRRRRDRTAVD